MTDSSAVGRPRESDRDSLIRRLETLRRIFVWAIPKSQWLKMNRPMARPYHEPEERKRLQEYSDILKSLPYSDLVGQCDPDDPKGIPALILQWQYSEGILLGYTSQFTGLERLLHCSARDVDKHRFEAVRRLVLFIIANQGKSSVDYLRKLWRKHDPLRSG